jgi:7-keto-8-aminopelargonate synthetase-like enzyme
MPPPIAAASIKAIEIMLAEPRRVASLAANGQYFLSAAKAAGLDTGNSAGINIVPIIVGSSATAVRLANALMALGVAVIPVIFPGVEERQARLRFFLSADHTKAQMDEAVEITARELARLTDMPMQA